MSDQKPLPKDVREGLDNTRLVQVILGKLLYNTCLYKVFCQINQNPDNSGFKDGYEKWKNHAQIFIQLLNKETREKVLFDPQNTTWFTHYICNMQWGLTPDAAVLREKGLREAVLKEVITEEELEEIVRAETVKDGVIGAYYYTAISSSSARILKVNEETYQSALRQAKSEALVEAEKI